MMWFLVLLVILSAASWAIPLLADHLARTAPRSPDEPR